MALKSPGQTPRRWRLAVGSRTSTRASPPILALHCSTVSVHIVIANSISIGLPAIPSPVWGTRLSPPAAVARRPIECSIWRCWWMFDQPALAPVGEPHPSVQDASGGFPCFCTLDVLGPRALFHPDQVQLDDQQIWTDPASDAGPRTCSRSLVTPPVARTGVRVETLRRLDGSSKRTPVGCGWSLGSLTAGTTWQGRWPYRKHSVTCQRPAPMSAYSRERGIFLLLIGVSLFLYGFITPTQVGPPWLKQGAAIGSLLVLMIAYVLLTD